MIQESRPSESIEGGEAGDPQERRIIDQDCRPLGDISGNSCWLPSADPKTKVKGKDRAIIEAADLSSTLPTPPPAGPDNTAANRSKVPDWRKDTLQDFYSFLDKLGRTSPLGSKSLEAYAEHLRAEVCKDCLFNENVLPGDDEESEVEKGVARGPELGAIGLGSSDAQRTRSLATRIVRAL